MSTRTTSARTGGLLLTAVAVAAFGPLVALAQDSSAARAQKDAARNQAEQNHSEAAREGRANDKLNNDPDLNNDQSPRRDDDHSADSRATDLHRTHPHAAARCHDGFFTTTHDRGRACTRHGGIDVWLSG